jgi:hypothetical protein
VQSASAVGELPIEAQLDDVVGAIDLRALIATCCTPTRSTRQTRTARARSSGALHADRHDESPKRAAAAADHRVASGPGIRAQHTVARRADLRSSRRSAWEGHDLADPGDVVHVQCEREAGARVRRRAPKRRSKGPRRPSDDPRRRRRQALHVDEYTGRNIDLVASRLVELAPEAVRALTQLPAALEHALRIGEPYRRAHPAAKVDAAVFSDGRTNVRSALKRNSRRRLRPSAAASREPHVRQFGRV